ncbi:MAG: type I pullulanase [Bacteroidota bacterium]
MKRLLLLICISMSIISCTEDVKQYASFEAYPTAQEESLWLDYSNDRTIFKMWSPTAKAVTLSLYEQGDGGEPSNTYVMEADENGVWKKQLDDDLNGTYYTYSVEVGDSLLAETPGIYAQAVGVNGKRAMVLDMESTNPPGWKDDRGPKLAHLNEAVIYELHIRDMTIHPESGSSFPGKYNGLVEEGTTGPDGVATGIDHLKELGITHVHLLPTFDHYAINEARLDSLQFNWGYDPQNYNVPEGSFSLDPFNAEVRIKEFKQMVQAFHDAGIGVILDVVYNHTGITEGSNFNLESPGYYYRHWDDGSYADASACGNETASERAMMRKFIIESVKYWVEEYHLDGFRFDLMGIHDIETMNLVTEELEMIDPNVFVYGEGWTAGDSPLPLEQRALKKSTFKMPRIAAFGDDLRDGLKGSVFEDLEGGFVSGTPDREESVKFGVVGCIEHPQLDYAAVNYSDAPWAEHPWQSIAYVSCHDNHTIYDKLKISRSDASEVEVQAMGKLANAVVLTSQGAAFIHAGAEMLRTKQGEHNSYNLPDTINRIDWNWKVQNSDNVAYYRNLIRLRKEHPAFRMPTGDLVRERLTFETVEPGLVSFRLKEHANGDDWKTIYVVYNARETKVSLPLNEEWKVAVLGADFYFSEEKTVHTSIDVPAISMLVLYQD